MMDIMTKNKIVWKDGIPCIVLDEQPVYLMFPGHTGIAPPRPSKIAPPIPSDIGRPIRGQPFFDEVWEFKIEFLQPDFTSLQDEKDQKFFEDILKELEEFFKGD